MIRLALLPLKIVANTLAFAGLIAALLLACGSLKLGSETE